MIFAVIELQMQLPGNRLWDLKLIFFHISLACEARSRAAKVKPRVFLHGKMVSCSGCWRPRLNLPCSLFHRGCGLAVFAAPVDRSVHLLSDLQVPQRTAVPKAFEAKQNQYATRLNFNHALSDLASIFALQHPRWSLARNGKLPKMHTYIKSSYTPWLETDEKLLHRQRGDSIFAKALISLFLRL